MTAGIKHSKCPVPPLTASANRVMSSALPPPLMLGPVEAHAGNAPARTMTRGTANLRSLFIRVPPTGLIADRIASPRTGGGARAGERHRRPVKRFRAEPPGATPRARQGAVVPAAMMICSIIAPFLSTMRSDEMSAAVRDYDECMRAGGLEHHAIDVGGRDRLTST